MNILIPTIFLTISFFFFLYVFFAENCYLVNRIQYSSMFWWYSYFIIYIFNYVFASLFVFIFFLFPHFWTGDAVALHSVASVNCLHTANTVHIECTSIRDKTNSKNTHFLHEKQQQNDYIWVKRSIYRETVCKCLRFLMSTVHIETGRKSISHSHP